MKIATLYFECHGLRTVKVGGYEEGKPKNCRVNRPHCVNHRRRKV